MLDYTETLSETPPSISQFRKIDIIHMRTAVCPYSKTEVSVSGVNLLTQQCIKYPEVKSKHVFLQEVKEFQFFTMDVNNNCYLWTSCTYISEQRIRNFLTVIAHHWSTITLFKLCLQTSLNSAFSCIFKTTAIEVKRNSNS